MLRQTDINRRFFLRNFLILCVSMAMYNISLNSTHTFDYFQMYWAGYQNKKKTKSRR